MTLAEIRKAKTSELIALMNPDTLARTIHQAMAEAELETLTEGGLGAVLDIVAAEIDRRIPVPSEAVADE